MMQTRINPIDSGLIGSISMIMIYLIWIALVFSNLAKPLIDYLFWLHFIQPIFEFEPFDFYRAINLLIIVSCLGFIVGYLFAKAFNLLDSNNNDRNYQI